MSSNHEGKPSKYHNAPPTPLEAEMIARMGLERAKPPIYDQAIADYGRAIEGVCTEYGIRTEEPIQTTDDGIELTIKGVLEEAKTRLPKDK